MTFRQFTSLVGDLLERTTVRGQSKADCTNLLTYIFARDTAGLRVYLPHVANDLFNLFGSFVKKASKVNRSILYA